MRYIVDSTKTVAQAAADLQEASKRNGFGVLHVYNIKEILTSKGFPQTQELQVFEVCNPRHANEVLGIDRTMNVALPCRISVWEESGRTRIGMIPPKAMLALLSDHPRLREIAAEVDASMTRIIGEAK